MSDANELLSLKPSEQLKKLEDLSSAALLRKQLEQQASEQLRRIVQEITTLACFKVHRMLQALRKL